MGKPEGRNHLEDPDVDGRVTQKRIFRKWDAGAMDWNGLAQDRDRWWTLVYAVMDLQLP